MMLLRFNVNSSKSLAGKYMKSSLQGKWLHLAHRRTNNGVSGEATEYEGNAAQSRADLRPNARVKQVLTLQRPRVNNGLGQMQASQSQSSIPILVTLSCDILSAPDAAAGVDWLLD